jgi:group I intron endonuclease
MKGTIYCVDNLDTGKQYIGQTSRELIERWREHCGNSGTSVSPKLKNSIKKYGKDAFSVEVVWEGECSQKELDAKEIEFIEKLGTLHPNGYNLTMGGAGGRHSDETKKLLSEKSKAMWGSKRDHMLAARRQQWTPERRKALSVTLKQGYIEHPERRRRTSSRCRSPLPPVAAVHAAEESCLERESVVCV